MLQLINDKTKGWTTWFIIVFIGMIFIFTSVHYFSIIKYSPKEFIGSINDIKINRDTYKQMLMKIIETKPSLDQRLSKEKGLQYLTKQILLEQDAKKSNISITDNNISNEIFQNPIFSKKGQYSSDLFNRFSNVYGGKKNIELLISKSLLSNSITESLMRTDFILRNEREGVSKVTEKKKIQYYPLYSINYSEKIKPKDTALKLYYNKNEMMYRKFDQLTTIYVEIPLCNIVQALDISQSVISSYYEKHMDFLQSPELRTGELVTFYKNLGEQGLVIKKIKSNVALSIDELKKIDIKIIESSSQYRASNIYQRELFNLSANNLIKRVSYNTIVRLIGIKPSFKVTKQEANSIVKKIIKNYKKFEVLNIKKSRLGSEEFERIVKSKRQVIIKIKTLSKNAVGNSKLEDIPLEKYKNQGFTKQWRGHLFYKIDKIIPEYKPNFTSIKGMLRTDYITQGSLDEAEAEAKFLLKMLSSKKVEVSCKKFRDITQKDSVSDQDFKEKIFRKPLTMYYLRQNNAAYWIYGIKEANSKKGGLLNDIIQNSYGRIYLNDYLTAIKEQGKIYINYQVM